MRLVEILAREICYFFQIISELNEKQMTLFVNQATQFAIDQKRHGQSLLFLRWLILSAYERHLTLQLRCVWGDFMQQEKDIE